MNNVNEAIGITRAAAATALPFVLSFTVETDGRLPTGDPLGAAIEAVDAATGSYPAYYMINCAHPTHFAATQDQDADWVLRVRGIRANASRWRHAGLEEMTDVDRSDGTRGGKACVRPCRSRESTPHANKKKHSNGI